jgi:hypothetical protein
VSTAARVWAAVRAPGVPPPGLPAFGAVVVVGTFALIVALVWHGASAHGKPAWHFGEAHAGTYYSGVLLAASAALSLAIARRARGRPLARFWLVACAGFLFLATDELTLIHEGVDKWIHARLGWSPDDPITDHLDNAIVILYGLIALVWGFRYRDALLRLRWATRVLVLAFALFVVTETLDVLDPSKALEESVKLLSETLIVVGLFAALRDPLLAEAP